jgi:hypothetical protein
MNDTQMIYLALIILSCTNIYLVVDSYGISRRVFTLFQGGINHITVTNELYTKIKDLEGKVEYLANNK